jgi:type VI secretion system secreted protein VgrG
MSDDLITISSSVLPDNVRVAGFRGVEAISQPYRFEIYLLLQGDPGEELDLADAVGAKARLVLDRAKDALPPYIFAGVFSSVELLHELDGRSLVRAVMVPKLWELGLSRHSRMFTKMSIPDIIKSILDDAGFSGDDYELRLGSYPTEEHVCQYRESDLAFISRWMEREGIFYFFEHGEFGEKLVLCDDKTYDNDEVGKPVRYFPQLGDDRSAGASFRTFTCRHSTLPTEIKLRDYNYANPNLDVSGVSTVAPNGAGEVNDYGSRFFSPGEGKRLSRLRSEEMLARQVVYHAAGTRLHLRAGYRFELEDHPRSSFNTKYLAIEAHHFGNQAAGQPALRKVLDLQHDDVYFVELNAIPAKTQFRAISATPWPRIYGYENGIVDGPASSDYAQIDAQGRYNVKFMFDESRLKDGGASTFVRMMQPHGGGVEGFHFPLRKNTEVVVSYLGGDPDRPVISGVVPNMLKPSPVTSGNHTKNVIQTGGRNRLEIEDLAGQERIWFSTPYSTTFLWMGFPTGGHEMVLSTNDNGLLDTGKNYDIKVGFKGGGDWTSDVKTNMKTTVHDGFHKFDVNTGTSTNTIKGDTSLQVKTGNLKVDVDSGTYKTKVKGDTTLQVTTGNHQIDVDSGTQTINVKGNYTHTIKSGNTKIDTKAGTTDILSQGLITVKSIGSDVYMEGDKVTTKSRADWSWMILGTKVSFTKGSTVDFKLSHATTFTLGITNNFFVGLQNSITIAQQNSLVIGQQNSAFIGGKNTLTLAAETSLTISAKLALELSISLTIGASLAIKLIPTQINQKLAELKTKATDMEIAGFKVVI